MINNLFEAIYKYNQNNFSIQFLGLSTYTRVISSPPSYYKKKILFYALELRTTLLLMSLDKPLNASLWICY